jgi:hypothetical protein
MLTGTEIAVLLALLFLCGITVALVMMTLRAANGDPVPGHPLQNASTASLGGQEQTAEFLVDLCEPMIFQSVGERDRDQAECQHQ